MRAQPSTQSLPKTLSSVPDFSNYNGGDSFTFNGKTFRKISNALGKGASGTVFCFEADDYTKVAVKIENPYAGNYWSGDHFQKEAQWYQKIYGLGVFSGDKDDLYSPHYILMPYFSGKTLDQIYFASSRELLSYWIKTAHAIQTLHTKHLAVHNDLKANNIMVDSDKNIFAIDFGLMMGPRDSKLLLLANTPASRQLFQQYPPESFSDRGKIITANPTFDIYALGILLRHLYLHFLAMRFFPHPTLRTMETITDVEKNLTHAIPTERWSIAKAIYMLTAAFFSTVPRQIWNSHLSDEKLDRLNHTNLMRTLWQETSTIAIAIRINELLDEQLILALCGGTSERKSEKIEGLRAMHSEIQIKNPEQFGTIVSKTKQLFPELTAGIFSRRTKKLVDELSRAAIVFH